MSGQSMKILAAAVTLPPIERAALIEDILATFDFPSRSEVDTLWAKEAEDRIEAFERGEMKSVPVEVVFDAINRRISG